MNHTAKKNHASLFGFFFLFIVIFAVYTASAVGLYNSMDAPQFFTTEALIQHGDLNIDHFTGDPHNFSYPDVYFRNNQTLGVRGYVTSVLAAPFHFLASQIQYFVDVSTFSEQVTAAERFPYELSVTMLFTLFTVSALILVYKGLLEITRQQKVAIAITLLTGFGTYMWKYSATYTRQGVSVLLLAISMYAVWRWSQKRTSIRWMTIFFLCWGVTFGVDIFLFLALTVFVGITLMGELYKKHTTASSHIPKVNHMLLALLPALVIIGINIIFNKYWYDTILFSQTNLQPHVRALLGEKADKAWLSTPLYPTTVSILFGAGKMPAENFRNFSDYDEKLFTMQSANYAATYNFYGIFIISPFLLFSILALYKPPKEYRRVLFFCFLVFILGILANTKVMGFWGGNQYDVRYFYPYTILLAIPTGWTLTTILKHRSKPLNALSLLLFLYAAIFSLIMGWLGVINMFQPALTGERRIWLEIQQLFTPTMQQHTLNDYLNATFMNRNNAWIAIVISCLFFGGGWLGRIILYKLKNK